MTKTYYPFNTGPGAMSYQDRWSKIMRECRETGVLSTIGNLLEPYADSTGMQIKLRTGAAFVMGHRYENDEEEELIISTADPTNPRIDLVVLHLDWIGSEESPFIDTLVLNGIPAASPSAPVLTQEDLFIWEIPIAQVFVGAGVVTINAGDVTDMRMLSHGDRSYLPLIIALGE